MKDAQSSTDSKKGEYWSKEFETARRKYLEDKGDGSQTAPSQKSQASASSLYPVQYFASEIKEFMDEWCVPVLAAITSDRAFLAEYSVDSLIRWLTGKAGQKPTKKQFIGIVEGWVPALIVKHHLFKTELPADHKWFYGYPTGKGIQAMWDTPATSGRRPSRAMFLPYVYPDKFRYAITPEDVEMAKAYAAAKKEKHEYTVAPKSVKKKEEAKALGDPAKTLGHLKVALKAFTEAAQKLVCLDPEKFERLLQATNKTKRRDVMLKSLRAFDNGGIKAYFQKLKDVVKGDAEAKGLVKEAWDALSVYLAAHVPWARELHTPVPSDDEHYGPLVTLVNFMCHDETLKVLTFALAPDPLTSSGPGPSVDPLSTSEEEFGDGQDDSESDRRSVGPDSNGGPSSDDVDDGAEPDHGPPPPGSPPSSDGSVTAEAQAVLLEVDEPLTVEPAAPFDAPLVVATFKMPKHTPKAPPSPPSPTNTAAPLRYEEWSQDGDGFWWKDGEGPYDQHYNLTSKGKGKGPSTKWSATGRPAMPTRAPPPLEPVAEDVEEAPEVIIPERYAASEQKTAAYLLTQCPRDFAQLTSAITRLRWDGDGHGVADKVLIKDAEVREIVGRYMPNAQLQTATLTRCINYSRSDFDKQKGELGRDENGYALTAACARKSSHVPNHDSGKTTRSKETSKRDAKASSDKKSSDQSYSGSRGGRGKVSGNGVRSKPWGGWSDNSCA